MMNRYLLLLGSTLSFIFYPLSLKSQTPPSPLFVYVDNDWAELAPGVDPDDTDPATAMGVDAFSSISEAIAAVAEGGVIRIHGGIYRERLEISKNITLRGWNIETTIIEPPADMPVSFDTGVPNKPIIWVHDTTDARIESLSVDGANLGDSNYRFMGIAYHNAGGSIDGVEIRNIKSSPMNGNQHGIGIYARNMNDEERTVSITHSFIHDYQKNGIAIVGNHLWATITDNIVTGSGSTPLIAQNGIQLSYGATGVIQRNTVRDNNCTSIEGHCIEDMTTSPTADTAAGVLIFSPGNEDIEISNNTLENNQCNICGMSSSGYFADGVQLNINIYENSIIGGTTGIALFDIDDFVPMASAIYENNISNHEYGVIIKDDTGTPPLVSPSVIVNDNQITGNTALGVWSNTPVDARNNWWGCTTGSQLTSGDCDAHTVLVDTDLWRRTSSLSGFGFEWYLGQRDSDRSWSTPFEMDWYSNTAPVTIFPVGAPSYVRVHLSVGTTTNAQVVFYPRHSGVASFTIDPSLAPSGRHTDTFILRAQTGSFTRDQPIEVTVNGTGQTSAGDTGTGGSSTGGSTSAGSGSGTAGTTGPTDTGGGTTSGTGGTSSGGDSTAGTTSASSSGGHTHRVTMSATETTPTLINQDRYDIGHPTLTNIYVSPTGSPSNDGLTPDTPIRYLNSLSHLIRSLEGVNGRDDTVILSHTGYQIILMPGIYPDERRSHIMDDIQGTAQYPIIIRSSTGNRNDVIVRTNLEFDRVKYMYLMDFTIALPGDVLHFGSSDHILVRNMSLNGVGGAHDMFKTNQVQHIYLEDSELQGAGDNTLDWVAAQTGRVVGNIIHDSNDWCAYAKGGSAYIVFEDNEVYDCGTGGITAGQGTGFEYMVAPWLNYETYDMKIVNNVIHDVQGAGVGVQGSYNTLIAYNTLYRVGDSTYHWGRTQAFDVLQGGQECDGDTNLLGYCNGHLDAGGWGQADVPGGRSLVVPIPNKNIYIYNNIVYNPDGYNTVNTIFNVNNPNTDIPSNSNLTSPSLADDNLVIRGNYIYVHPWVGYNDELSLFSHSNGCPPSHPTCNAEIVNATNTINTTPPQLQDPDHGDFHPVEGGNVFSANTYEIPDFTWNDLPTLSIATPVGSQAPLGNISNIVPVDKEGIARTSASHPGAYTTSR